MDSEILEKLDLSIAHAEKAKKAGFDFDYAKAAVNYEAASIALKEVIKSGKITDKKQLDLLKGRYDKFRRSFKEYEKKVAKKDVNSLKAQLRKLRSEAPPSAAKEILKERPKVIEKRQNPQDEALKRMEVLQARFHNLIKQKRDKLEEIAEKQGKGKKKVPKKNEKVGKGKKGKRSKVEEVESDATPDEEFLDLEERFKMLKSKEIITVPKEEKSENKSDSEIDLDDEFDKLDQEELDKEVEAAIEAAKEKSDERVRKEKEKSQEARMPKLDMSRIAKDLSIVEEANNKKVKRKGKKKEELASEDIYNQAQDLFSQIDKYFPEMKAGSSLSEDPEAVGFLMTKVADEGRALGENIGPDAENQVSKSATEAEKSEVLQILQEAQDLIKLGIDPDAIVLPQNTRPVAPGVVPTMLESDSEVSDYSDDTPVRGPHRRRRERYKKG